MNSDEIYKLTERLSKVNSVLLKERWLRSNANDQLLRKVLYYTYNPYYTYGLTGDKFVMGVGHDQLDDVCWRLLDVLRKRRLTGNRAIATVQSYIHKLSPFSGEVFKRILNGDLRCGISKKRINNAIPGLIPHFEVMLANDYSLKAAHFPGYLSIKYDGLRAVLFEKEFYSRGGKVFRGFDIQRGQVLDLCPGYEGRYDGEMIIPGVTFEKCSGQLRSDADSPDAIYHIFDMPDLQGDFNFRYHTMQMLMASKQYPNVCIVTHHEARCHEDVERFYKWCRVHGYEGCMYKTAKHFYRDGRNNEWLKRKESIDLDLRCVGVYDGKGKYEGSLGGIKVRYNNKIVKVGSGFSDAQRRMYSLDPGRIVGRTVQVTAQERTSHGSLRHPRFVRLRNDKDDV